MRDLLCLIFLIPILSFGQRLRPRVYKAGTSFRYQLTTESFRNKQLESKTISVSQHRIVKDGGKLTEEIQWVGKELIKNEDTIHLDSIAHLVPPYHLSLLPGAAMSLPPLTIPEMMGEITDLHTFYVAISPALKAPLLGPNLLSLKDSILRGQFGDGKSILKGEDCIEVTQKLLNREKELTLIETSFLPPAGISIPFYVDSFDTVSYDSPVNFQMIQKGTGDKVNYLWGTEQFIIISTLDNRSGQLLKAEMVNELKLKMRYNYSPDLKTFQAEFPLTIRRELHLQLLR